MGPLYGQRSFDEGRGDGGTPLLRVLRGLHSPEAMAAERGFQGPGLALCRADFDSHFVLDPCGGFADRHYVYKTTFFLPLTVPHLWSARGGIFSTLLEKIRQIFSLLERKAPR